MGKTHTVELDGSLWFNRAESKFLGGDRIALLEKVDALGSITQAAKAVGIKIGRASCRERV